MGLNLNIMFTLVSIYNANEDIRKKLGSPRGPQESYTL